MSSNTFSRNSENENIKEKNFKNWLKHLTYHLKGLSE